MIKISPSTNPSGEENLLEYAKELQDYGVQFIHCDVMDGVFVENKCLPVDLIEQIAQNTQLGLDIHLMVDNPQNEIHKYIKLPANYITTHFEAYTNKADIIKVVDLIHKEDILAGLSIKPNTNINLILPYLPYIDLILIMSVEPGKSGQEFIESTILKIKQLNEFIKSNGLRVKIEVDGGINKENIRDIANAGANMVVVGSALYNSENRKELIDYIQGI